MACCAEKHERNIYFQVYDVLDHVFIPEEAIIHLLHIRNIRIMIYHISGLEQNYKIHFCAFRNPYCVPVQTCFQSGILDLSWSPWRCTLLVRS